MAGGFPYGINQIAQSNKFGRLIGGGSSSRISDLGK